jgi:thioredoxin 1
MVAFITELNNTNYNDFIKNDVVLVDIWAQWCGPCKQISPIVDEISIDFKDRVFVGKLDADADDNKEILAELGVRNIPTILIFKNGVIVDKSVGMVSKTALEDLLNKHL